MPTMPNCIGLTYQAALSSMVSAGVRVTPLGYFQVDPVVLSYIKTGGSQPGFVVAQSPAPGTTIVANAPAVLTLRSYPMAVSSDSPVESPEIEGDSLLDGLDSIFILDESELK